MAHPVTGNSNHVEQAMQMLINNVLVTNFSLNDHHICCIVAGRILITLVVSPVTMLNKQCKLDPLENANDLQN